MICRPALPEVMAPVTQLQELSLVRLKNHYSRRSWILATSLVF